MRLRAPGILGGLVLVLCCVPRGPATEPGPVPEPDAARPAEPVVAAGPDAEPGTAASPADVPPDTGLLCLPLGNCGCFTEPECVAVRLRADGITVDIVAGPRAGQTGNLLQHCLGDPVAPTDCIDYVDPAIVCRRPSASPPALAKYVCASDGLRPHYTCGFVDGTCSVR
ncbi:MAG: hypothetical protein GYA57_15640 [Myxococcales bacterium]|nr:hypothetical protein [Myxococcales bacterium]